MTWEFQSLDAKIVKYCYCKYSCNLWFEGKNGNKAGKVVLILLARILLEHKEKND